jgi:hypothetical protein
MILALQKKNGKPSYPHISEERSANQLEKLIFLNFSMIFIPIHFQKAQFVVDFNDLGYGLSMIVL